MAFMGLLPEKLLTPEEEELTRKKTILSDLEAQLANRELELASFRADLLHFEKRYLEVVGRRYAILDELRAKIAEARARQNPHSQKSGNEARQARSKAEESARAAGHEKPEAPAPDEPVAPSPKRSESLRNLYRQWTTCLMFTRPQRRLGKKSHESPFCSLPSLNLIQDDIVAQILEDRDEPTMTNAVKTDHPHIIRLPGVCGGEPIVDGLRVTVRQVATLHKRGESIQEIGEDLSLTEAQVYHALSYFLTTATRSPR